MTARSIKTLAVAALVAGGIATDVQAQGLTFGAPVRDNAVPARPSVHNKAKPVVQCRHERHQVYDAQGRLQWRTIRVCG